MNYLLDTHVFPLISRPVRLELSPTRPILQRFANLGAARG